MRTESVKGYWGVVRYVLLVGVTGAIFLLLFSQVNRDEFFVALQGVSVPHIFLTLVCSLVSCAIIAAARWRGLLQAFGCMVSYPESVYTLLACYPVERLFPLKTGRLLRFVYLKKKGTVSLTTGAVVEAVTVVASFLGLFVVLAIAGMCMLVSGQVSEWQGFFVVMSIRDSFCEKIARFKKALSSLFQVPFKAMVFTLLCTMIMHALQVIAFYIVSKGLGVVIPLPVVFLCIPVTILIANIPVTIAGLGTREACIVLFFRQYATQELLLAAGVVFSLVWFIAPAMIGLFFTVPFFGRVLYKQHAEHAQ